MATLKERRESDRRRNEKWRKKQSEIGKKAYNIFLTKEAQGILNWEKENNGGTNSDVIERALKLLREAIKGE